jgi:2-oxoglutarate dehydrogenase E2 component (dihydrolipoamide succinyltransferase)
MATNIVVPELGESVVEARVAKWLKNEGDPVAVGDPLVELETEKIDLEVSADREGVLAAIKHREGDDVKVGEVLAVLETGAAGSQGASGAQGAVRFPGASGAQGASASSAQSAVPSGSPAEQSASTRAKPETDPSAVRATPTARNVARQEGVGLGSVPASGPAGRIMKDDVLRAAPGRPPAPADRTPAPAAPQGRTAPGAPGAPSEPSAPRSDRSETRVRMSKRRQTIARRLVEAQHNAAMLTTFNEVDMSAIMSLRERRKEAFQKAHGVGLGIASFFIKAAVAALRAFPHLNAEIQGDEIVLKHYYDIGVAVGAEGGLVVPVIRDADRSSFADIELAIRDFAKRAADGTLTLEDLKGGTFTITNGGVFGSLMSTPILNPPQVGILGLHKIADRVLAVNGQVVIKPMMYLALSYDHRIVDGREAVQCLVKIKDFIEDPAWMFIS